jgi:hypothetical protein
VLHQESGAFLIQEGPPIATEKFNRIGLVWARLVDNGPFRCLDNEEFFVLPTQLPEDFRMFRWACPLSHMGTGLARAFDGSTGSRRRWLCPVNGC